ncbi:MAG: LamG-like jellyroll fold domain-containing protein [Patescibacteria group bacterium]
MPKEKKETTTKARSKVLVSQKIIVSFLVVSSLAVLLGIGSSIVQMVASPKLMVQREPGGGGGGIYVPPTSCGDTTCNGTEDCSTCPADCGDCLDPSLALWLPLNNDTNDASFYEHPIYCSSQTCPSPTSGPKPDQGAYDFDGTDDYLVISDADILDVDSVTLAAWIKSDVSGQQYSRILAKEYGSTEPIAIYIMLLGSDNKIGFHVGVDGTRERLTSDTVIPTNQWIHVVATYDGTGMKIYLNGQLTDSDLASSPGPIQDNDLAILVSNSQFFAPRFFDGSLSDLRIYNRALNLTEVQELYGEEISCIDEDEDGYSPTGGDCGPIDCNDDDQYINPGVSEICYNGVDDNCNGIQNENCGGTYCTHGQVTSQCLCGEDTVNTGYCCAGIIKDHECLSEGNEKIVMLTHSTGLNLYEAIIDEDVLTERFNLLYGTDYVIERIEYPHIYGRPSEEITTNNMPWHYFRRWIEGEYGVYDETLNELATEYDVVMFKQCYPSSDIYMESVTEEYPNSDDRTVGNYKIIYNYLKGVLDSHPDTEFVAWTLPPRNKDFIPLLGDSVANASRASDFSYWLLNTWLEDGQNHDNIQVFDFRGYVVESSQTSAWYNFLKQEYEISSYTTDSHPNDLANNTVAPYFVDFVIQEVLEGE